MKNLTILLLLFCSCRTKIHQEVTNILGHVQVETSIWFNPNISYLTFTNVDDITKIDSIKKVDYNNAEQFINSLK